jgi:cellulose synthase/poly-beta-1,6-N-acetylglucosamine synthase-like glycosyltransferase
MHSFSTPGTTFVTVIIPFRNEEIHIPSLLKALKSQTYPTGKWNVLFVDDHSTDRSCTLIQSGFPEAELIFLPSDVLGKKSALEYGAKIAKGELLLFTDADCTPGNKWISSMVSYYESIHPVLISAPVILEAGNSFFSKFQALEFLSLSGSGAASFGNQNPIMANGANLAVRRDIYIENLENRFITTPSGDDIFLLLSLKKKYPGKLVYLKSDDAIVRTSSMPNLKSFILQRLRWTSKARHYKDKSIILTSILVFFVNFWLLACIVSGLFISGFFIIWGAVFLLKSSADYIFLKKVAGFTGQGSLLKIFVLSQLVYFLYIGFTGIVGNLTAVKWKERKIKT